MTDEVLRRIMSLSIGGFRGFVDHTKVNTDADIVLVTGPNGFGKTSLLQALQLLLTGHHDLDAEDLFAFNSATTPAGSSKQRIQIRADSFFELRSSAQIRHEGETKVAIQLDWQPEAPKATFSSGPPPGIQSWPRMLQRVGVSEGEKTGTDEEARNKIERAKRTLARVTTFYPERVDDLFTRVTTGTELRDIFFPMPEPVRVALEGLRDFQETVQKTQVRVQRAIKEPAELETSRGVAQRAFDESWHPFRASLGKLVQRLERVSAEEWELKAVKGLASLEYATIEELTNGLQALLGGRVVERPTVGKEMLDTLILVVERERDAAQRDAHEIKEAEKLLKQQQQLEERLHNIHNDFPRLDVDLRCFSSEDAASAPDLLAVFRSVAENTGGWLDRASRLPQAEQVILRTVLLELQAVVPGVARLRAQELEQWLLPRRKAAHERAEITLRLAEIARQLEGYRESEDVRRLNELKTELVKKRRNIEAGYSDLYRAQNVIDLQGELNAIKDDLEVLLMETERVIETLERVTGANLQILKSVADLAEKVLKRFSLTAGIVPLDVCPVENPSSSQEHQPDEPHSEITASGLRLSQLSTGQRAQMAVSLAVAQSELLRVATNVDLPFHVLLLDDVSTAYDLSNLTREAVLWRQLAYHKTRERRWQLFLSSHHEDMTNHLLDLLVPPDGASLRVLRFTGWSRERGPEIEQFWVQPSEKLTDQAREAIKQTFKEELCLAR